MGKIKVLNREITTYTRNHEDYICITDIARYKNPDRTDDLIRNWLRNRNTIEFLGIWEHLNNPDFKPVEFDGFRKQAGLNSFTLTPGQWIELLHPDYRWFSADEAPRHPAMKSCCRGSSIKYARM